jgi:hypothetical protein
MKVGETQLTVRVTHEGGEDLSEAERKWLKVRHSRWSGKFMRAREAGYARMGEAFLEVMGNDGWYKDEVLRIEGEGSYLYEARNPTS